MEDVSRTAKEYADRYNACQTEEERQAFIAGLTPEERREMHNAAIYIKLQALNRYASLTSEQREALQRGDISVL